MADADFDRDVPGGSVGPCDLRAFARLRRWGGERLVRDLVQLFLAQVPERLAAARQGVREGNPSETERAVHALRSSSAHVGAVRMRLLCERVEECAAEGDLASIPGSLDELEKEFVRYVAYLSEAADQVETTG